MAKLSARQKKKIIADFVSGKSKTTIAEEYGVSRTTIRRVLEADPTTSEKVRRKKEQDTLDMLAYMDGQKGYAQEVLRNIIEALNDPEKLKRANVRDLSTAYGIIIDKFFNVAELQQQQQGAVKNELLQSLYELERNHGD